MTTGNWYFLELESTDSTMLAAQRHLRDNPQAAPFCLAASQQTAGYGKEGRVWQTPQGNLACTFALPLPVPLRLVPLYSYIASLAVARSIEILSTHRITPWLKWPNDVLVNDAKVAGILLETFYPASEDVNNCWLLVGIGVNVATAPPAGSVPYPVTSLLQAGLSCDRVVFLETLQQALSALLEFPHKAGWHALEACWLAYARDSGDSQGFTVGSLSSGSAPAGKGAAGGMVGAGGGTAPAGVAGNGGKASASGV